MSEFEVDTEVLRSHASRLSMVTDAVALAEGAANQVDLHGGAFGVLCAFLPGFVNSAEVETGQAIGAARDSLEAMADGVVAMADDYRAVDDGVRGRMDTIAGVLR
ncbi:type VII secretion target [Actinotalea solisilvae]|uniref:type VII secretion target n=1 Tax=Actinotalea solisilvae TaxID=2072922 RepID=UPI0018F278E9|nr:type VII secretion target [Actinotalea solisilvae]